MLKIIGTKNCSRCIMIKSILDKKNIKYEYNILEELSEEDINKYIGMAKIAGLNSMPLIIKDGELITIQEV